MSAFHELSMPSLEGDDISFAQFEGQACLVVNVASRWGLTPQYAGLRALHHDTDGLQVLGFPCNQFAGQEPGSAEEIREFVSTNYDVDFPIFAKIDVNGDNEAPLYSMLKAAQPGDGDTADIAWNFEKFLVSSSGEVIARWAPPVTPEEIQAQLPDLLS